MRKEQFRFEIYYVGIVFIYLMFALVERKAWETEMRISNLERKMTRSDMKWQENQITIENVSEYTMKR